MTFSFRQTRLAAMHWLAVALCTASLMTGLRIHASSQMLGSPGWLAWLPEGPMHAWHLISATAWLMLALAYTLHRRTTPRQGHQASWSHRVTMAGPWLFGVILLSGLAVYLGGWQQAWGLENGVQFLHRWAGLAMVLWLLAHVAFQLQNWRWRRILRTLWPASGWRPWLQGALALPLCAGLGWWALSDTVNELTLPSLQAASIELDEAINVDGLADEAAWQRAAPVHIETVGVGADASVTEVTVRALKQGEVMHFLFSWPDSSHSMKHLPLLKTSRGWVVQQQGYATNDEQIHYEDKLAVMWATQADAAGQASMHMGPRPLAGRPGSASGRGLHATPDGVMLDVWHWKSVRLHGTQQLDDNHFTTAYPDVPGATRYTGGYKPDPALSGGYSENWMWFREGVVTPKRLPKDPASLAPFQRKPGAADAEPAWGMSWYETRPYAPELDTYPVGTLMPSVLWTTVLEGDRGDVRAQGHWSQGRWTLEISRGLKAESRFDLELKDGVFMWVAAFDHTQTRHTYHLRPIRLKLP